MLFSKELRPWLELSCSSVGTMLFLLIPQTSHCHSSHRRYCSHTGELRDWLFCHWEAGLYWGLFGWEAQPWAGQKEECPSQGNCGLGCGPSSSCQLMTVSCSWDTLLQNTVNGWPGWPQINHPSSAWIVPRDIKWGLNWRVLDLAQATVWVNNGLCNCLSTWHNWKFPPPRQNVSTQESNLGNKESRISGAQTQCTSLQ
jgi:hypothetical protein